MPSFTPRAVEGRQQVPATVSRESTDECKTNSFGHVMVTTSGTQRNVSLLLLSLIPASSVCRWTAQPLTLRVTTLWQHRICPLLLACPTGVG